MATTKVIVVLEVELEKDVENLGAEICKRIAMHGNIHDANVLSVAPTLEYTHAPKPRN